MFLQGPNIFKIVILLLFSEGSYGWSPEIPDSGWSSWKSGSNVQPSALPSTKAVTLFSHYFKYFWYTAVVPNYFFCLIRHFLTLCLTDWKCTTINLTCYWYYRDKGCNTNKKAVFYKFSGIYNLPWLFGTVVDRFGSPYPKNWNTS